MTWGIARRAGEAVAGQGRMVARVQAGVTLLQLHRYLAKRGLECSFAPGAPICCGMLSSCSCKAAAACQA